jgi:hypothetical protein
VALTSLAALFASMAAFLGGMYLVSTRPLMKRMDDLRRDFGERLTRIETRLDKIEERLTAVEKKVDAKIELEMQALMQAERVVTAEVITPSPERRRSDHTDSAGDLARNGNLKCLPPPMPLELSTLPPGQIEKIAEQALWPCAERGEVEGGATQAGAPVDRAERGEVEEGRRGVGQRGREKPGLGSRGRPGATSPEIGPESDRAALRHLQLTVL